MSRKTKEDNSYFVLTGKVGRYEDYNNAIKMTKDNDPGDVLTLPRNHFKSYLRNELFKLTEFRDDLDYSQYHNFISEEHIEILQYMQDSSNYTSVYLGRNITPTESTYVMIMKIGKQMYYYKNRNSNLKYKRNSDIVPLVFLKAFAKKNRLKGSLITYIPLEKSLEKVLPDWRYVKYNPTEYNIIFSEIQNILEGLPTIFDITELKGDI